MNYFYSGRSAENPCLPAGRELRPHPPHSVGNLKLDVGLPGIEPGLHPPHGRVLPVYYSPIYF